MQIRFNFGYLYEERHDRNLPYSHVFWILCPLDAYDLAVWIYLDIFANQSSLWIGSWEQSLEVFNFTFYLISSCSVSIFGWNSWETYQIGWSICASQGSGLYFNWRKLIFGAAYAGNVLTASHTNVNVWWYGCQRNAKKKVWCHWNRSRWQFKRWSRHKLCMHAQNKNFAQVQVILMQSRIKWHHRGMTDRCLDSNTRSLGMTERCLDRITRSSLSI